MTKNLLSLSLLSIACTAALAQNSTGIAGVAQRAIETSPEVAAKFNAFKAAADEIDIANGALRPRVDLTAEAGRTNDRLTNRNPQTQSLNRTGAALSITQLLWDGGATTGEVARLGHARMARYFDFVDATEQTALEAVRAYHDVERYRRLVSLAQDNYVQHRYAFDQIQSRVKAGVARGVDSEQAGARLALAESNLITEKANLHDVTERYRRVVGAQPDASPASSSPATLLRSLPNSGNAALSAAAMNSPTVAAAIENLRATRAQAESRKGAYQPRVEARLRAGAGNNFDGVEDQKRDVNAQVTLAWNLYNGGSDDARQRQSANLLNQAADLRDKACRDTRQTVAIAFNDNRKLDEQLGYLDRNVVAIERARDAYRQQFDIGQRSLLDLLNAENELYTARRSYALALFDKRIAEARTHAGIGQLTAALGLKRADTSAEAPEAGSWAAGEDAASRCPLSATEMAGASREELDARVRDMTPKAAPAPMPAAAPVVVAPVAPAPASASAPAGLAEQRLRDWAAAWMSKDLTAYYGFYGQNFGPLKADRAKWMADRKRLVTKAGDIKVDINNIKSNTVSPTRVETTFEQRYASKDYSDTMTKTLTWALTGDKWVIVKESNR
ncbi:TolC family outer membrane protein [Ideonella margarita]|uniref:TolC family outer membrane protein n=1 Tax=Ideonella margarita TaxID=2984191 RepID=A0ABU9CA83_9BURK